MVSLKRLELLINSDAMSPRCQNFDERRNDDLDCHFLMCRKAIEETCANYSKCNL